MCLLKLNKYDFVTKQGQIFVDFVTKQGQMSFGKRALRFPAQREGLNFMNMFP